MSDLWGPISASEWRSTPCILGRTATEADIAAGNAVFCIPSGSEPASVQLPCCAIQTLEGGTEQPVVVIQAEVSPQGTFLGVRPLTGGNGVCTIGEVRLLPHGFEGGSNAS